MATLVLTVVGQYLGGPIGGAIGATIGQQIDRDIIFAPPGRQGPRLSDLSAQASSYGKQIPKLFGTNRVAGNVIWATNLTESSSTSGGKGQPSVTNYSYTASFAVMLSARPIAGIGRIWADGNLLRGAAGDWKETLGAFRLYSGSEDQPVDPLIASAEGVALAPAHRGYAYVVFENLLLDNFGRRVPSLTFEIYADGGAITLAQVITSLTGAGVTAQCPTAFGGYAASGDSVRGAVETLTAAVPVRVQDDGATLSVVEQVGTALALDDNALGATAGNKVQKLSVSRESASKIAQTLVLAYYDPARDYQQSMQRARRDGGVRKEQRLDLPVALDAVSAKTLVENRLDGIWAERVTAKLQLPWRYLPLRPGDDLSVPGSAYIWRISKITFNKMVLECDVVRTSQAVPVALLADSGRNIAQLDAPAGPTTLTLLDLPQLTDGVAAQPIVMAAAAGASEGWRVATLSQSIDNGASWQTAGQTAPAAVIGQAVTALAPGSAALIDMVNTVTVRLFNAEMMLANATDDLLLSGSNVALLGGELIQFGTAVPLGDAVWLLSRLWRGRRGTEDRMVGHAVGEAFTLITANTLASISVPAGTALLRVNAQGVGDTAPLPEVDLVSPGLALRPPNPVALMATPQPNGDTLITWIRRSRDGWRWVDGVDAPLAEEVEAYGVTATPSAGTSRLAQVSLPQWLYSAQARAADRAAGATTISIAVAQIGTVQSSLTTSLTLSLT